MRKTVATLGLALALLLTSVPAQSARSGYRTTIRVTSIAAPRTVIVTLCSTPMCAPGGTAVVCAPIQVDRAGTIYRDSCATDFEPLGMIVDPGDPSGSALPADVTSGDAVVGDQYVVVKLGKGKFG